MRYTFKVYGYCYVEGSAIVEADNDLEAYNKFKSLLPTEINLKLNSLNKTFLYYNITVILSILPSYRYRNCTVAIPYPTVSDRF